MARIKIEIISEAATRIPELAPLEVTLPLDQVQDLWQFATCLATKGDVLLPAIMAVIGCAQGSAPPRR